VLVDVVSGCDRRATPAAAAWRTALEPLTDQQRTLFTETLRVY
jgi:hypothetical protein